MLLTVKEIEEKLYSKFSPFQGEMDDLILKKRVNPPSNVLTLEQKFHIKLPADFLSFITIYDLDNFSLGNISFGSGGDYIEKLIFLNKGDDFNHWWSGNSRPDLVILIAISDPYTILLNTDNGKLYAISGEPNENDDKSISDNFELFVRAVGSLFLKNNDSQEVINFTGAQNQAFWHEV